MFHVKEMTIPKSNDKPSLNSDVPRSLDSQVKALKPIKKDISIVIGCNSIISFELIEELLNKRGSNQEIVCFDDISSKFMEEIRTFMDINKVSMICVIRYDL